MKKPTPVKKSTTKKPTAKKSGTKTAPTGAVSVFGPDLQKRMDYEKAVKSGKPPAPLQTFDDLRKKSPMVDKIANALNEIIDPEVGVGIVDLGLIYGVTLEKLPNKKLDAIIIMTLTSMGCPVGPMIMEQVQSMVPQLVPEIESAGVQIVWDPPWGADRIKPEIRDMLFGF